MPDRWRGLWRMPASCLKRSRGQYPRGVARPNHRRLRQKGRKRFRLGWPEQYYFERVDGGVRTAIDAAVKTLEQLGARIERVSLPHLQESVEASTNLGLAEATSFHESQGYYPARAVDYGEDVRGRLEAGTKVRATDYLHALKVKKMLRRDFDNAFERVDAILAPASPIPAPRLGENEVEIGGGKAAVRGAAGGRVPAGELYRTSGIIGSVRIHARGIAGGAATDWTSLG